MPTYDYLCEGCGHEMEVFQSINADVLKTCPECNKDDLKRQFGTGAAIVFKGSGFYQTDYRSDNYKKGQKADKPKDKKEGGSESKKSDSGGGKSESSPKAESKPSGGGKSEGGSTGKSSTKDAN